MAAQLLDIAPNATLVESPPPGLSQPVTDPAMERLRISALPSPL
jgi:hypothetical protein